MPDRPSLPPETTESVSGARPRRSPDLAGAMIGRYAVHERAGHGGMGEVYRATDTLLRRDVALKRVSADAASTSTFRQQILGEARKASRVNDPGIASVYDVLEHAGEILIVMEYVEGPSLRDVIAQRPDLDHFWEIAGECVRALGVAHEAGLVHRDIKPANIMLTKNGQVKILDFGLAKRFATGPIDESASTESYSREPDGGTPAYMPPEAHLGRPTDHRADFFSLGLLFYELLTGRHPFRGATIGALVQKIVHETPDPITEARSDVPVDLSRIISKMIAKRPEDRYQSAEHLLADLEAVRGGRHVSVSLPRPRTSASRSRRPAVAGVTALVLGTAIVYLSFFGGWERLGARLGLIPLPDHRHLAVLPLHLANGEEDRETLALGMTRVLRDGLARMSVHPPLQVASLSAAVREGVTTPARAREALGANVALVGDVELDEQAASGEIRLIETGSGRVLRSASISGGSAPREILTLALEKALDLLELPAGAVAAESLMSLGSEGAGTLDFHLRGLGRLESASDTSDVSAAIDWFHLAARTDPSSALNTAAMARAYRRMYRMTQDDRWLTRAESTAREAIALDSTRADAHETLALALWDSDRPEEAISQMRRAVDLDPTDEDAVIALGRFHGRRGLVDQEEAIYREAADRRPHAWKPYYWLATKVFYEHGRFDEAREAFAEMIRRAPEHHIGYESLGGLQVLDGEYDEAAQNLQAAIALHPSAEALTNLGAAYFNQRNFDRAVDTFNEVFRHDFADYLVWINLADAYYFAPGRRGLADEAYRQGIRLGRAVIEDRPYDAAALAHLARAFATVGEADSARAYLDRAIETDEDNPVVHYCAALMHWRLGERDRALDWLESAVEGGHPVQWLEDSPTFDEWRDVERFRSLVSRAPETRARES